MASLVRRMSLWNDSAAGRRFPSLDRDLTVDVAVVGGGIAGLTAALLLKRAGKRVCLLEACRIGEQVTGHSNAKITALHSLIYADLIRRLGESVAMSYARANLAAMNTIRNLVDELGIECGLISRPAYTVTADREKVAQMEEEVEAARSLGLPASLERDLALPGPVEAAVRFDDQAQFDPVAYLRALVRELAESAEIREETRVTAVEHGEPCVVSADGGTVTAGEVIVATNLPVVPEGEFYKKTSPRAHLCVAAPIDADDVPEGMYLSIDAPTHSVRAADHDGRPHLIVVGESFAPGRVQDVAAMYDELAHFVRDRFPVTEIAYRWKNMDYDSVDRLPFIGRANRDSAHLWVATGFCSWGITLGTAAGIALSRAIAGQPADWAAPFDAAREPGEAENSGQPPMRQEKTASPRSGSWGELEPGEAAVFQQGEDDQPAAVFRAEDGALHARSAKCTHMGCVISWNSGDRTWDCPCHGSVFAPDGTVLHGPALEPLAARNGG